MTLNHKYCLMPCLGFLRIANYHSAAECNHYKTLGLSPTATKAEIKAAYYELSKKHHPDRNQGSDESSKIFRHVKAAYEVLGNEQKRMQYDRERIFKFKKPVVFYDKVNPDYQYEAEKMYFHSKKRPVFKKHVFGTTYYDFDAWFEGHYGKKKGFETTEPRQFRQFGQLHQNDLKQEKTPLIDFLKSLFTVFFYTVAIYCTYVVTKNKQT